YSPLRHPSQPIVAWARQSAHYKPKLLPNLQSLINQSPILPSYGTIPETQHQGGLPMISSVVLLNVEHGRINEVAERLAELEGISEVYSVAGRYDLVAIVRVAQTEELADLVTEQMLHIKGITNSETLIAFRVFSRHDLESMFSIGLE